MSDATADPTLTALHERRQELLSQYDALGARLSEVERMIEIVDTAARPRRGRPKGSTNSVAAGDLPLDVPKFLREGPLDREAQSEAAP